MPRLELSPDCMGHLAEAQRLRAAVTAHKTFCSWSSKMLSEQLKVIPLHTVPGYTPPPSQPPAPALARPSLGRALWSAVLRNGSLEFGDKDAFSQLASGRGPAPAPRGIRPRVQFRWSWACLLATWAGDWVRGGSGCGAAFPWERGESSSPGAVVWLMEPASECSP
jgi:hypothetical protein